MNEIADSRVLGEEVASEDASAMADRLFRVMIWAVGAAVVASAAWMPWRVTAGLFIGGALSLLNHHWMRTAITAAFALSAESGARPKLKVVRFVARYIIVAAAVVVASWLDIASLTAMLVGLCSFVVAALAEGFMQAYFVITHREETK